MIGVSCLCPAHWSCGDFPELDQGLPTVQPIELGLPGEKRLVGVVSCHGKRGNGASEEPGPLLPPPPEARGEQGWQLLLLGHRHHSSLRSAAEAIVPCPLASTSITQELPAWLPRCRTCPQRCVRMWPPSPLVLASHLATGSGGACRADDRLFS